ncbi:FHA domain-containing protein [Fusibacter bizertensis]
MLPSKLIIPLNEFSKFEADMIKEANLKCFQELQLYQDRDQNYMELSWHKNSTQQTVLELLEMNYFELTPLKHLINAISDIQKNCADYLLFPEKIDFSPNNIFYDASLNQYLWRYVPVKNCKSNFEISHLITILMVKSGIIENITSIQNAISTPNEFLALLDETIKVNTNTEVKSFWQRFNRKKNTVHDLYQQTKTTHKTAHPILMVKSNPQENYKLYFDNNIIGREDTCNIHINSPSISRQHALIFKIGHNYHLKDMGSTNGTILNGQQLISTTQLVNGDSIQLGEKELMFIR